MKVHDLKCIPPYFDDILAGRKPFEVRKNDRNYEVGDHLRLREWRQPVVVPTWRVPLRLDDELVVDVPPPPDDGYTGREVTVEVTYMIGGPSFLPDGVVAMGIRPVDGPPTTRTPRTEQSRKGPTAGECREVSMSAWAPGAVAPHQFDEHGELLPFAHERIRAAKAAGVPVRHRVRYPEQDPIVYVTHPDGREDEEPDQAHS